MVPLVGMAKWGNWASEVVLVLKATPPMEEMPEMLAPSLGQEDPWRRARNTHPVFLPGELHQAEDP